jgi:hypothetical protein
MSQATIKLTNIQGIARKSGTDQDGLAWIEFEVDELAEQTTGECSICGAEIASGWLCLDGGDEACDEHVEYEEIRS